MNDHDLLIKLDQKMTDICVNMKTDSQINIKAHNDIMKKIDEQRKCIINQSKTFVSSKLFYWLLGFVILGLVGTATFSADNNTKISNLATKVEMLHHYDEPMDE